MGAVPRGLSARRKKHQSNDFGARNLIPRVPVQKREAASTSPVLPLIENQSRDKIRPMKRDSSKAFQ